MKPTRGITKTIMSVRRRKEKQKKKLKMKMKEGGKEEKGHAWCVEGS